MRILASLAAILLICSCSPKEIEFDHERDGLANLKYEKERIRIDGSWIEFPTDTLTLTGILGEPDRTHDLLNDILVWDSKGIYAYRAKDSDTIHDVSVNFRPEHYEFIPKSTFSGHLSDGSVIIDSQTKLNDLLNYGFTRDKYEPNHLSKDQGIYSLIVDFDSNNLVIGVSYGCESSIELEANKSGDDNSE